MLVSLLVVGRTHRLIHASWKNTHWEGGEESAWSKTHKKGELGGLKIPFGARVWFKPNVTRPNDVPGKYEPDALEGVFGGYEIAPGYTWIKRYLVWAVTDFDGLKLRKNIAPEEFKLREPFRTSRLVVPAGRLRTLSLRLGGWQRAPSP